MDNVENIDDPSSAITSPKLISDTAKLLNNNIMRDRKVYDIIFLFKQIFQSN